MKHYIFAGAAALLAFATSAQDLNTDISVTSTVVPEERAATRLRLNPQLIMPEVMRGRISPVNTPELTDITPFINMLQPADYQTSAPKNPWRGYAALGYGPTYNLAASAGYRFISKERLSLDGYMQFNGMSYRSHFTSFENIYPDKVGLHRNTALIGANTRWTPTGVKSGELTASMFYQFSGYNFPILDIPTGLLNKHSLTANVMKVNAAWKASTGVFDYSVAGEYNLIAFARDEADNGGKLSGSLLWHASDKSAWGLDLRFSVINSTIVHNKGIVHLKPHYDFAGSRFSASIGANIDVRTGNAAYSKSLVVAPDVRIMWKPSDSFNVWGRIEGRLDDNNRLLLYNEQPYLLPSFDASFSRIYSADAGLTLGPWRGGSIGIFAGYITAKDWYMPAYITGEMMPMDVKGLHGGVTVDYSYLQYLSLNLRAEWAQSPNDNFSRGYALWRDHAGFNLTARATIRPIAPLEINLGYHLRTHRSKILAAGALNLRSISNLTASVRYAVNRQWSAFISGENLLNNHWYLGPSVPSQGIMCMIGATYKF